MACPNPRPTVVIIQWRHGLPQSTPATVFPGAVLPANVAVSDNDTTKHDNGILSADADGYQGWYSRPQRMLIDLLAVTLVPQSLRNGNIFCSGIIYIFILFRFIQIYKYIMSHIGHCFMMSNMIGTFLIYC